MTDMVPGTFTPAELETYWTVQQIADAFQMTTETVRSWIKNGQLKALKIGVEWRVPNKDLVEFTRARYAD